MPPARGPASRVSRRRRLRIDRKRASAKLPFQGVRLVERFEESDPLIALTMLADR
jgi:hypothetical protein